MAWIKMIKEGEATGRLKELYEQYWGGAGSTIHSCCQDNATQITATISLS